jgi:hypothetical protein
MPTKTTRLSTKIHSPYYKYHLSPFMTVSKKGGTGNGGKQKIFPAKIGYLWTHSGFAFFALKKIVIPM